MGAWTAWNASTANLLLSPEAAQVPASHGFARRHAEVRVKAIPVRRDGRRHFERIHPFPPLCGKIFRERLVSQQYARFPLAFHPRRRFHAAGRLGSARRCPVEIPATLLATNGVPQGRRFKQHRGKASAWEGSTINFASRSTCFTAPPAHRGGSRNLTGFVGGQWSEVNVRDHRFCQIERPHHGQQLVNAFLGSPTTKKNQLLPAIGPGSTLPAGAIRRTGDLGSRRTACGCRSRHRTRRKRLLRKQ